MRLNFTALFVLLVSWSLCAPLTSRHIHAKRAHLKEPPFDHKADRILLRANEAFTWPTSGYPDLEPGETYVGPQDLQLTGNLVIYFDDRPEAPVSITVTKGVSIKTGAHYLYLSHLTFTKASTYENLDVPLIDSNNGALSLRTVTFDSITMATTSLLSIGVKEVTISYEGGGYSYYSPVDMSDVLFKAITRDAVTGGAKAGGSVFEITHVADEFELTGATFDNCKCPNGLGGAVYIKFDDEAENSDLDFDLAFTNVAKDAAKTGLCTYIDFNKLDKDEATDLYGLYPQVDGYHMFVASDQTTAANLYTLVEAFVVVVGTTGTAGKDCGSFDKPCSTITAAVASEQYKKLPEGEEAGILIADGTHSAETAALTLERTLMFYGAGNDPKLTVLNIQTISGKDSVFTLTAKAADVGYMVNGVAFTATAASSTGVFTLTKTENNEPTLYLSFCLFQNSAKTVAYSKPVIDARGGRLVLIMTQFEGISLDNCPLLRINHATGAFSAGGDYALTNGDDYYSYFDDIHRTSGNGALLEETLTADSHIVLSGFYVYDCSSTKGVGIFYFTVPETAKPNTLTCSVYRREDKPGDATNCIIGFEATKYEYITGANYLNFEVTESDEYTYYGVIGGKTAPLIHFSGPPKTHFYITPTTVSDANCGWQETPCGKFAEVVPNKAKTATSSLTFTLTEGTHAGAALEIVNQFTLSGTYDSEASGDNVIKSKYTVAKGVTFTVTSSSQLSINNLIVTGEGSTALEASLITTQGTLSLYNVHFTTIALKGHPLIGATDFSITASPPTIFTSISRTDDGTADTPGASVFIFNTLSSTVEMEGLKFDSCSGAKNGLGGAIYVSFAQYGRLNFSPTPFSGTVSNPEKGKYMYMDVTAIDSSSVQTFLSSYSGLVYDTTANVLTVKYIPSGKTDPETKDLHELLGITQLSVEVVSTATDATCSTDAEDKKCQTLPLAVYLINSYGTATGNTITLNTDVTSDDGSMSLSKGVAIAGGDKTLTYKSMSGGTSLLWFGSSSKSYSVSNLKVVITTTSSDSSYSLISQSSDTELSLSKLSFTSGVKSGDTITQCYLKYPAISSSGKLTLSEVSFSSITLANNALLSVNTAAGMFDMTSTCTFTNIIREKNDGSVFSEYLYSGTFIVRNAQFTKCQTLKGNGGAMSIDLRNKAIFTLSNCKFTSCEAGASQSARNNAYYKGGAIYLECVGTPTVTLESVSASGCKASGTDAGNVLYCKYEVDDGETVPDSFWENLMKGFEDVNDEDFVAVIYNTDDNTRKTIRLSEYAGKEDDGFPLWAIIVIVVGGVLLIAGIVIGIVVYMLKCRKGGKVDVTDKTFGEEGSTTSAPAEESKPSEEAPAETTTTE